MIQLLTKGKKYFPDMILPLTVHEHIDLQQVLGIKQRYKIICVTDGVGLLSPGRSLPFSIVNSPGVVCLNEADKALLKEAHDLKHTTVCFHPEIINSNFSYGVLKGDFKNFTQSDYQDLFLIEPFRESGRPHAGILSLGPIELIRIKQLCSDIRSMVREQNDAFWPCKSRAFLMELLFLVRQIHINQTKSSQELISPAVTDEFITKIILYLHTNYYKKLTVRDIAKEFSTNRTTLSRQFKAATGHTLIAYVNRIRLSIAGNMLHNTRCSIQEICERIGFSDISYFGRLFKRRYGRNPSAHRTSG